MCTNGSSRICRKVTRNNDIDFCSPISSSRFSFRNLDNKYVRSLKISIQLWMLAISLFVLEFEFAMLLIVATDIVGGGA